MIKFCRKRLIINQREEVIYLTLALSIKVNDGLVLAADSATTMSQKGPNGQELIMNIYDNANKVFNLHKKLPIGLITWGLGNIGKSSIETIVKDFRCEITEAGSTAIDVDSYTMEDIARRFYEYIYTNRYVPSGIKSSMGFVIGGYSKNADSPEEWTIQIDSNGMCAGPVLAHGVDDSGGMWFGQPEAITRLIRGHSNALGLVLRQADLSPEKINEIIELCARNLTSQMIIQSMPIKDAVDLAKFLIETTINYIKYQTNTRQTVGGPIEIAVITKHEGFKWVDRKLYFSDKLNP